MSKNPNKRGWILGKKVLKANDKDVLRMQGILSQNQNEETASEDAKI
jgi:hypothetical protein